MTMTPEQLAEIEARHYVADSAAPSAMQDWRDVRDLIAEVKRLKAENVVFKQIVFADKADFLIRRELDNGDIQLTLTIDAQRRPLP